MEIFSHTPSEEERIRLIGELICKAILAAGPADPATSERETDHPESPALDAPDRSAPDGRILEYLRRNSEAAPGEMVRVLGLSRSTAHRALQRLVSENRVVATGGRTSAAAYRLLAVDPSRN
jgi:uncharacterized membrane protein